MPDKVAEYMAHAAEAERLAELSRTQEERAAYERIAAVWRNLAVETGAADGVSREQPAEATPLRATAKSQ